MVVETQPRNGVSRSFQRHQEQRPMARTDSEQGVYFADIYQRLADGGCFFDLDNMRPRDDFLRQRYSQVPDPTSPPRTQPRTEGPRPAGGRESPPPGRIFAQPRLRIRRLAKEYGTWFTAWRLERRLVVGSLLR